MTHRLKINGMPKEKEYNALPWSRQLEWRKQLADFQSGAKIGWLDTKRRSVSKAVKEFIDLYQVDQYYFVDQQSDTYHDDSIKIWWVAK